ncbi:MAG TPA: PAS domain S-box protein [Kiritimatiellia bacterium]|nr:PAS domain S-box protein [Kiritimatiellia bacterium]
MRFLFYRLAAWIRDTRRTGYARPILITVLVTAVLMSVYKALEFWMFPELTLWQSRITALLMSCLMTALMAYLALRLYRQMAQDTIDELTERLRLSEELLEERNLVKSLMENSVDRIFFKDLDGRYIRASASVAQAFGLAHPGEVVGRGDFDFFTENYARQMRRDEQQVIETRRPVIGRAYEERWKDGRETWSSVSMVPLCDRHGHVIGTLGIARDITESRAQEQRFRQLSRAVEQSPHMVLITDRSGSIEYVNPRFCEITGYAVDEALGRNPRFLRAGAQTAAFFQGLWGTVLAGQEWRGEFRNRKKNGEEFWVRSLISPIRNAAGEITNLVAVTEDISREKEAAAAILAEQQRRRELERIVTISPAVVFLWRAEADWPVEFVSDNVSQWGYTVAELTSGRVPYSSIVHPEDLARVADEIRHYIAGGIDNFIQEYRIIQRSGEVRWLEDRTWVRKDATGRVTHFQGVVFDVTDRKTAETAQQALLEGLRTVLQLTDELIACPTEESLYLRAVELARERLGFERCGILVLDGERVRGTFGTGFHGETTDEHAHVMPMNQEWSERFRIRGPHENRWVIVEEPYRSWTGERFEERGKGWVALTPIQSSAHESIGVFCNDTALTRASPDSIKQEVLSVYCSLLGNMIARKRAEVEQLQARVQQRDFMERADRLNSLGLLAAGMAHEINNPLQGMMSHLRAVERSLPEEAGARTSLSMVERGIETIAALVRKLLFLGTTEKGLETADARECVEFVTQLLAAPLKRARVRIEQDMAPGRLGLAMPRRELIQVLLNLMINARDAMPGGGTIRFESGREGNSGYIRISDTGPGIPPEIAARIFTPFFTTKGTQGTGLGLSVAESLVRTNHGQIRVESPPGEGARFTVVLPLA